MLRSTFFFADNKKARELLSPWLLLLE